MAGQAIIIGGSGQIGRATALNLLDHGWDVVCAMRNVKSLPEVLRGRVTAVEIDRSVDGALDWLVSEGTDALIDTVAFDEHHAAQLLDVQPNVGHLVVISTGSVYRGEGDGPEAVPGPGMPKFPVPLREDHPRWAQPGSDYSSRKSRMEDALLAGTIGSLSIIRPAAIHGPGCRSPREWWVLKRLLEGRTRIPLAHGGRSRFHTTSTANLAELIRVALGHEGVFELNAGDPEAHSAAEIVQAIIDVRGSAAEVLPLADEAPEGLGAHPWGVRWPLVLDMSLPEVMGYRPVTSYRDSLAETLADLEARAAAKPWREAFPGLAPYPDDMFDLAIEDRRLAEAGL